MVVVAKIGNPRADCRSEVSRRFIACHAVPGDGFAFVRLFAMHGAAGHGDYAKGLWRRVRRDGVKGNRRRHELRLADHADRGDGRQGRGRDHLPHRHWRHRRDRRAHQRV
jgi:hypothetical protein